MVESREDVRRLSQSLATHRDAIYRYILTIVRDPAVAEDLTQDTVLRAHGKLNQIDNPTRLVPWLYRIATNVCHDRFRHSSSRQQTWSLDTDTEDPSPRLDKVMEQKEMSACVQEYVVGLSDSYRAVILLHDTEELTNPEIADMLGVSVATVKIRLHRARAKLREALSRACAFSTDERGVTVCERKPPVGKD